jgi:hypothetical protein
MPDKRISQLCKVDGLHVSEWRSRSVEQMRLTVAVVQQALALRRAIVDFEIELLLEAGAHDALDHVLEQEHGKHIAGQRRAALRDRFGRPGGIVDRGEDEHVVGGRRRGKIRQLAGGDRLAEIGRLLHRLAALGDHRIVESEETLDGVVEGRGVQQREHGISTTAIAMDRKGGQGLACAGFELRDLVSRDARQVADMVEGRMARPCMRAVDIGFEFAQRHLARRGKQSRDVPVQARIGLRAFLQHARIDAGIEVRVAGNAPLFLPLKGKVACDGNKQAKHRGCERRPVF